MYGASEFLYNLRVRGKRGPTIGEGAWTPVPPHQRPRVTGPEVQQRVLATAQELRQEIKQKSPAWRTAVRLDLLRVLPALSRKWRPPTRSRHGVRPTDLSHTMPALTMLHTNPGHRATLADGYGFSLPSAHSLPGSVFQRPRGNKSDRDPWFGVPVAITY